MAAKKSNALYTVLAVVAALLVVGGLGLFWIAFKGVQMLKHEAAHAGSAESTTITTATATPTPTPSETGTGLGLRLDDEEEPQAIDAGICPLAIHPYYCRGRCRAFSARKVLMHARRIAHPTRAGIGKCDTYDVFAEDDATGGIVEYFDETGQLAGVTDSRQKPCSTFGKVPTCKLDIKWEAARGGGLGDVRK